MAARATVGVSLKMYFGHHEARAWFARVAELVARHPAVADAAVVGKKDSSRGEVVVAFVVVREAQAVKPEHLRDFAREQALAQWKVPREIHFIDELPRSPTGKVLKRVLAEKLSNS